MQANENLLDFHGIPLLKWHLPNKEKDTSEDLINNIQDSDRSSKQETNDNENGSLVTQTSYGEEKYFQNTNSEFTSNEIYSDFITTSTTQENESVKEDGNNLSNQTSKNSLSMEKGNMQTLEIISENYNLRERKSKSQEKNDIDSLNIQQLPKRRERKRKMPMEACPNKKFCTSGMKSLFTQLENSLELESYGEKFIHEVRCIIIESESTLNKINQIVLNWVSGICKPLERKQAVILLENVKNISQKLYGKNHIIQSEKLLIKKTSLKKYIDKLIEHAEHLHKQLIEIIFECDIKHQTLSEEIEDINKMLPRIVLADQPIRSPKKRKNLIKPILKKNRNCKTPKKLKFSKHCLNIHDDNTMSKKSLVDSEQKMSVDENCTFNSTYNGVISISSSNEKDTCCKNISKSMNENHKQVESDLKCQNTFPINDEKVQNQEVIMAAKIDINSNKCLSIIPAYNRSQNRISCEKINTSTYLVSNEKILRESIVRNKNTTSLPINRRTEEKPLENIHNVGFNTFPKIKQPAQTQYYIKPQDFVKKYKEISALPYKVICVKPKNTVENVSVPQKCLTVPIQKMQTSRNIIQGQLGNNILVLSVPKGCNKENINVPTTNLISSPWIPAINNSSTSKELIQNFGSIIQRQPVISEVGNNANTTMNCSQKDPKISVITSKEEKPSTENINMGQSKQNYDIAKNVKTVTDLNVSILQQNSKIYTGIPQENNEYSENISQRQSMQNYNVESNTKTVTDLNVSLLQQNPKICCNTFLDEKQYLENFNKNETKQNYDIGNHTKPLPNLHTSLLSHQNSNIYNSTFQTDKQNSENLYKGQQENDLPILVPKNCNENTSKISGNLKMNVQERYINNFNNNISEVEIQEPNVKDHDSTVQHNSFVNSDINDSFLIRGTSPQRIESIIGGTDISQINYQSKPDEHSSSSINLNYKNAGPKKSKPKKTKCTTRIQKSKKESPLSTNLSILKENRVIQNKVLYNDNSNIFKVNCIKEGQIYINNSQNNNNRTIKNNKKCERNIKPTDMEAIISNNINKTNTALENTSAIKNLNMSHDISLEYVHLEKTISDQSIGLNSSIKRLELLNLKDMNDPTISIESMETKGSEHVILTNQICREEPLNQLEPNLNPKGEETYINKDPILSLFESEETDWIETNTVSNVNNIFSSKDNTNFISTKDSIIKTTINQSKQRKMKDQESQTYDQYISSNNVSTNNAKFNHSFEPNDIYDCINNIKSMILKTEADFVIVEDLTDLVTADEFDW